MPDYTLPQARSVSGLGRTEIAWTDFAFNPLRAVTKDGKAGWACVKVASGCKSCYAESLNKRWGTGLPFTPAGMKDVRVVLDEARVAAALTAKPRGPFRAPDGRPKVFVCDMTDVFGEWVPFETIDRLFALFALRQDIDWQILTKRPERMAEYTGTDRRHYWINEASLAMAGRAVIPTQKHGMVPGSWPLHNVWLGCSAATQADLDRNVPHLLRCPAAVRFLSLEPLVESVDLTNIGTYDGRPWSCLIDHPCVDCDGEDGIGVDWIIVGGESGPKARPCPVEVIRDVVQQCGEAGTACFVKQMGSRPVASRRGANGWKISQLDAADYGYGDDVVLLRLRDSKGGDPAEWPADLRVRQWPERKDTP